MDRKIVELQALYESFEAETADYRSEAACAKGCAFCCMEAGSIDITTLEGWVIRDVIGKMPRAQQKLVKKALLKDMKTREEGGIAACPFLMKNKACMIYGIRPFACRRIYSLHRCSRAKPPMLHRQVMSRAQDVLSALQRLDENGYTGHMSFILNLLEIHGILTTYQTGGFKPQEIMEFGKAHRIVINRMVA